MAFSDMRYWKSSWISFGKYMGSWKAAKHSHNHIMYVDPFAWMMQYAAGMEPSFMRPDFCEVVLKTRRIASLNEMSASYDTIYGKFSVCWSKDRGKIAFHAEIPKGICGRLEQPDGLVLFIQNFMNTEWSEK